MNITKEKIKNKKVISLFSGAGGLDLGFKEAGFDIIFANDFDKDACETYSKNVDKNIICGDIRSINENILPKNVDVLLGGFPCQGFSIANKNRDINDKRNHLYEEMIRVIKYSNPKIIVAENVKGILSLGNGIIFEKIKQDLKNIGYKVDYRICNTAYFGVPQFRERVIIIANNQNKVNLLPTETIIFDKGLISVEQSIDFLKDAKLQNEKQIVNGRVIYNHIASTNVKEKFFGRKYDINQAEICDYLRYYRNKMKLSTKKIDEIFGYRHTAGHWFRKDNNSGSIPRPNDWLKLKEILKFDNKYDSQVLEFEEKKIIFEQSLRITNWNKPSDTITATSPEIHINKKRRLSVRECAIIQTFPDNFIFYGSLNSMYRQVGNAVPVKFANIIAKNIINMLD